MADANDGGKQLSKRLAGMSFMRRGNKRQNGACVEQPKRPRQDGRLEEHQPPANHGDKREISKGLADMPFIIRGNERETRAQLEKRQRAREDDQHWVLPAYSDATAHQFEEPIIIDEGGLVIDVDTPILGRQSFGSFNPTVERRNKAILEGRDPNLPQLPKTVPGQPAALQNPLYLDNAAIDVDAAPPPAVAKNEEHARKRLSPKSGGKRRRSDLVAKSLSSAVDESVLKKKRRKKQRKST